MVTIIGFILSMLLVLILAKRSVRLQEIEKENAAKQEYLAMAEELYEVLMRRIEKKRKYRHDLAKHIRTLETMMDKQTQQDELKQYLEGLKAQYHELSQDRLCEDDLVDAVLSVKVQQCAEQHISLKLDVQNCMYGEIEDIDLVGMLENLLDNALEAQEKIADTKKRWICLIMRKDAQQIWITVENRIDGEGQLDFRTKKKHPEEHGLGLQIIDQLVKKYHGTKNIVVDQNQNLIRIELILQISGSVNDIELDVQK